MSDAGPSDLGGRFRAAREARGFSLSEVADQIRIRSVYLAAIEDEAWSAIGAPVYIRGFIRTYARFLKLDPEEAVAAFNAAQPESAAPGTGPSEPPRALARPRRTGPLLWVAGIVAVLLVAFVVYNELTMHAARTAQTPFAAEATETPAAAVGLSPSPAVPAPILGAGANSLALVLSAPSWLRVTVDGNVSMEGTFPAGTSKTFHGKSALVRLGNAGGVEIYVDGIDRGKLGKSGDVVEKTFTL
jgi:cytoskeleton protein RodZ